MARGGKRDGAGRPKGTTKSEGMTSRVKRVQADVTDEMIDNLLPLRDLLSHWEDECLANPDNPRHYFLRQAIEEIRSLGYLFLTKEISVLVQIFSARGFKLEICSERKPKWIQDKDLI